jgi:hypothetical protein
VNRYLLMFSAALLLIAFSLAQNSEDLIGTWQAQTNGNSYAQTINADGTYTFEILNQNYLEQGTWQLDGTNFSQQWQDPTTGEAQQATYWLEFQNETSFRMSGGNLEGAVYTFNRIETQDVADNTSAPTPVSTPLTLVSKDHLLHLPPPEAGEYSCSSSNITVGTTFDPTGSFGSTLPVYGVDIIQSLVGNLVLDGNGNYSMTKSNGGAYNFDETTNQVTFTGELEAFPIDYFVTDGWFTIRLNFTDAANNQVSSLSCSHESPNAVAPMTATPNPGLPGTLGLHTNNDQIIKFFAEMGEVQVIGTGIQPYQAANGETIFVSNNGLLGDYPEFTILASDGTLAARLEVNDSQDIKDSTSTEDIFGAGFSGVPEPSAPILSDDGNLIAYNSVDDLGHQNVVIRRRVGDISQLLTAIPDMTQPTWTKDGGLIMAGTEGAGGIYISDASFTNLTRISVNANAPALSPDGQTVVFIWENALWLVAVDGSNPRVIFSNPGLDIFGYSAWSPDGQWVAVAVAEKGFEAWSWILLVPADGHLERAQRLELPDLSPLNVNRNSRITWRE